MEDPHWNQCFICASAKQETAGVPQTEPFNPSTHSVLLKYLMGACWDTEGQAVYKEMVQLTRDNKSLASSSSSLQPEVLIRFCMDCDSRAEQLVELQKELKAVQNKIAARVTAAKDLVICNSRMYGSNVGARESVQQFEKQLYQGRVNGGEGLRQKRKFLDILHLFQKAVFGKDIAARAKAIANKPPRGNTSGVNLKRIGGNSWEVSPQPQQTPQDFLVIKMEPEEEDGRELEDSSGMRCEVTQEVEMEMGREDDKSSSVEEQPLPSPRALMPNQLTQQVIIVMNSADGTSATIQKCVPLEISGGEVEDTRQEEQVKVKVPMEPKPRNDQPYYKRIVKRAVKCKLCPFSSKVDCCVEQHFQGHETDKKERKCPNCNKWFTHKQTWERHTNHYKKTRKCDVCHTYQPVFCMEKHLRKHHGKEIYRCEYCPFVFGTYIGLLGHIWLGKDKELKCQLCPAEDSPSFHLKANLIRHLYDSHGYTDLAIKCDLPECSKIFFTMGQKQRHMNIHEGKFLCSICNKLFESANCLKIHIRTKHEKVKPFQCDVCGDRFGIQFLLNKHRQEKHGLERYKCDLCPGEKKYNSLSLLRLHKKTVHGGKRFKCPHCDHETLYQSALRIHIKTHSDKKDFKCEFCGFATRTNSGLQRHMLQHGGEKKYQCSYCPKTFLAQNSLKCHERVHTGEKPYQCYLCGVAYSQRCQLSIHNKKKHPVGTNPQFTTTTTHNSETDSKTEEESKSEVEESLIAQLGD